MYEIAIKFQEQEDIIICDGEKLVNDICENFSNTNSLELTNLFVFYKGNPVIFEDNLSVEQLFYSYSVAEIDDVKRMEILIFLEKPFRVTFLYTGPNHSLILKETDKIRDAFRIYANEEHLILDHIYFLYNANYYVQNTVKEKTIFDIANRTDKKRKEMNINVGDSDFKANQQTPTPKSPVVPVTISAGNNIFKITFFLKKPNLL